jgi:ethanolamine utilization protein EutJ
MSVADVPAFLRSAYGRYRAVAPAYTPPLRFGVDLGTATIVLTAIDALGAPVYWDNVRCEAVRDGVVVDFARAVREVRSLVARAAECLGVTPAAAATAYPPGVPVAEARACRYVLEQSGLACRALVDEVSAAQALLGIANGAVVDVGGGSTGVGIFRDGTLVRLSDTAGGGLHLDLIVAGALRVSVEEAERIKRAGEVDVEHIVRPGIERIAEAIRRQIGDEPVRSVHLVGGALMLPNAAAVVSAYLGTATVAYPHADLITPFGMVFCDG